MQEAASSPSVPDFRKFMNPCLEVLRQRKTTMSNDELDEAVAVHMRLDEKVLAVPHDPEKNPRPEAFYRLAWARSYLKKVGLIDNPERASWQITDKGLNSGPVDPSEVVRLVTSGADAESLSEEIPDALAEELLAIH
jgi:restriction system protein